MARNNSKEIIVQAETILSDNDLKRTQVRIRILVFLLSRSHAVSKNEIEDSLSGQDRITVYRTIKSFEEKGLIHRIQGFEGEPKYALNLSLEHHHEKPHVHFHCLKCLITLCLPIKIPLIKLPRNFQAIHTNLAVEGICEKCS